MYTIDGPEGRQLVLEHGLAELENRFTRVVFSLALWKFVFSVSMPEKFLL